MGSESNNIYLLRKALIADVSDFEDAVMMETAKRMNADCIVTRNIRDYINSPVPVMSPEQFVFAMNTH